MSDYRIWNLGGKRLCSLVELLQEGKAIFVACIHFSSLRGLVVLIKGQCLYAEFMKRFPFVRVGLLFAFSPLLIAFVTALIQGVSMWDEGSGTGAYIWLMMLTLPVGFVLVSIGIVMKFVRMRG